MISSKVLVKRLPTIPDETCPLIDSVIEDVLLYENEFYEARKIINTMEKIRNANSTLRQLGREWYEYYLEAESEVEKLNERIEELENDNSRMCDTIEDLEDDIKQLESNQ